MTSTTAPLHESPTPSKDPLARLAADLKRELAALEQRARAVAQQRLAGTKVEQLLEKLPAQIEGEVDALLGRVGLVRKARVDGAAVASAEAAVADVVADVVADAADVGAVAPDSVEAAPAKKKPSKKA
jgi:hypothetical protein